MEKTFMDTLLTKFDKLGEEMKMIRGQISEMDVKLKKLDILDEIHKEVKENSEKIIALEFEIEELKSERSKSEMEHFKIEQTLLEKIDHLENQQRRNNVIIVGIAEQSNESWADSEKLACDFLKSKLNIDVKIERAHRLGTPKQRTEKPRPIIVRLESSKDKQRIFENVTKLKGTGCYINEDYSTKTREERAKLIKFAKSKFPGRKFKLKVNRLQIDSKNYIVGHVGIVELK